MNATNIIHPQRGPRSDDPGLQVVPGYEKQVVSNDYPIYLYGPERPEKVDEEETKTPKTTYCGLRPAVFWTLLVIALLVVVGGAVGGGIGGTIASRHSAELSSQTSSSSPPISSTTPPTMSTSMLSTPHDVPTTLYTVTASNTSVLFPMTNTQSNPTATPVTSGTSGIADSPCPGKNLTTLAGSDGSLFTLLCAVDWPSGIQALSGKGTVHDLTRFTRYTLPSCIADCVDWNDDSSHTSKCKGIVYTANLTAAFGGGQDGNCFLKSAVGTYFPNSGLSMAAGIMGG
ncbi:hypothetical protein N7539_000059 [Penicillium diatomitis]|uniref:Apple domain-containing protein n=1 Tax=Penicillium diatomitis TaxID=2819901 RepID=A0A9W9XL25_9EURO|nr:uncharacterized protein N7539_000059 [Penicillium diatomitis]KAJ5494943.1 hypothetical protein N7539_000059 [Penicillium diatomitis]